MLRQLENVRKTDALLRAAAVDHEAHFDGDGLMRIEGRNLDVFGHGLFVERLLLVAALVGFKDGLLERDGGLRLRPGRS